LQAIDWQVIVEKHGQVVWQTAYRLLGNHADASDCFQETFICALEVSRRQQIRSFRPLLARLATTRAIDRLRQRIRQGKPNIEGLNPADFSSTKPGPVENAENNELGEQLRESLAVLSEEEAQAFCLRSLNNMSYRQIAKELGIKTNAAGVLLHRAKAKLRDALMQIENRKEQLMP